MDSLRDRYLFPLLFAVIPSPHSTSRLVADVLSLNPLVRSKVRQVEVKLDLT
jgi:hypothetical protein